ncbi:hypothetical protein FOZ60_012890 [Perkinsus olseni]|uniref:Uncharacterized protein n=1 Tax=Perkinsus olseni TaxID=32597 RepID=A0A7J6NAC0_PEROL|nr:hypothetical protein FOZ60_012890 [Perkinsus olseni]
MVESVRQKRKFQFSASMLHLVALSAAALVIVSLAEDEHAWLVPRFDDSFEDMDEGAMSGVANKSGLPGPYERPAGKCTQTSGGALTGCHCKENEAPRGIENTKGPIAVACAPPCDYRRVLGQDGGLRSLKGPPMLSCATPSPYGTVCRDASCFVTPHGDDCPPGMGPYSVRGETGRVCLYPI